MKLEAQSDGIKVSKRPLFLGVGTVAIALCLWFNHHAVIRITNDSGSTLSVIVSARDGVVTTVKQTALLAAGQAEWVPVPCTGHCSYLLNVQFDDGRTFETEERYGETWRIASEKVGAGVSIYK